MITEITHTVPPTKIPNKNGKYIKNCTLETRQLCYEIMKEVWSKLDDTKNKI